MELVQKIDQDLNQALKAQASLALLTLRQLKTAITNAEIANHRQKLTPEAVLKILKTEVKKRREAIELYQRGQRPELAQKEQQEIEIINQYLPAEMAADEISKIVAAAVKETGAAGPADMGKVMAALMTKLQGQADGKLVNQIVREQLSA